MASNISNGRPSFYENDDKPVDEKGFHGFSHHFQVPKLYILYIHNISGYISYSSISLLYAHGIPTISTTNSYHQAPRKRAAFVGCKTCDDWKSLWGPGSVPNDPNGLRVTSKKMVKSILIYYYYRLHKLHTILSLDFGVLSHLNTFKGAPFIVVGIRQGSSS